MKFVIVARNNRQRTIRDRTYKSSRSSFIPCSHEPRLLAVLICPAAPMFSSRLPHAAAKNCARSSVTYSSSELAATILGKGNPSSGIGIKPFVPGGYNGASTSLGATSNAPFTRYFVCADQCATVAHPKLCATSTTSLPASCTAASSAVTHSGPFWCFPIALFHAHEALVLALPVGLPMLHAGVPQTGNKEYANWIHFGFIIAQSRLCMRLRPSAHPLPTGSPIQF